MLLIPQCFSTKNVKMIYTPVRREYTIILNCLDLFFNVMVSALSIGDTSSSACEGFPTEAEMREENQPECRRNHLEDRCPRPNERREQAECHPSALFARHRGSATSRLGLLLHPHNPTKLIFLKWLLSEFCHSSEKSNKSGRLL